MTENKKRPNKKRTTGRRRRRSYRGLVDFLPHLIVLIVMIILAIAAMVMVKKCTLHKNAQLINALQMKVLSLNIKFQ